ncbi:MAG: hypothetical protein GY898_31300 [Proteobacteria bacterium]|nr:hypothetical protein [Pseudomonadota bacterium]
MRLSLATALLASLSPAVAAAAVCEDGFADVSAVLPVMGELDAPSNTKIFIGEAWTRSAVRLEVRRAIAPFSVLEVAQETKIVAGRDEVTVLHLADPLPHSAYKIFAIQDNDAAYELGAFASEDDPDTIPPEVPGGDGFEPAWETGEIPGCGLFADGQIYVPIDAAVLLLDVRDEDDGVADGDDDDSADSVPLTFDADALHGTVDGMFFGEYYPDFFALGNTPCLHNWPLAVAGASTEVRFGALDLAGNFSGWGDWHEITVPREIDTDPAGAGPPPDEEESGCSAVASRAGGRAALWALALVALYAPRRRWHTPPP